MGSLLDYGAAMWSKAMDYGDAAIQYFNQKKLNRQAQNDTQQNMRLQKQLNLEQQYDSIAQYTSALRAAGLNPALASAGVQQAQGVSMAGGSAGQAAKPDNSIPAMLEAQNALDKQESEVENIKANTKLQKAEADLKTQELKNKQQDIKESESRIALNEQQQKVLIELAQKYGTEALLLGNEYRRALSQDSVAHHALMDYCDRRLSRPGITEAERDYWTAFRAIGRRSGFDSGALMAMKLFSEAFNELDDYETEAGARAIQRAIQEFQAGSDEFIETVAALPVHQVHLILAQTVEALENASFRRAYREDLLPSEKAKLDEDVRVQKHNDPAGMLKDGDYKGFGVYLGAALARFAGTVYAARQFGKGSTSPSTGNLGKNKGETPPPAGATPKTASSPKPSNVPQVVLDEAVRKRLYSSLGVERTEKLYAGYRKSKAKSFDEYLKSEGIGQKRNYTATDWMQ